MSKKVLSLIDMPPDLGRRQQLIDQLISPTAHDPTQPGDELQLTGFSTEALRAVTAKAADFDQAPGTLVKVHLSLDMPEIAPDVLKQLIIPQAATAPAIAVTQADALGMAGHNLTQDLPLTPAEARALGEKHEVYACVATGVKNLLRGIERGRAAGSAARVQLQDRARAWVTTRIAELPDGDPRKADLSARLQHIDSLVAADRARTDQIHAAARRERDQVIEQLDAAEADLNLATVISAIRAERTPDPASLLQAARHLKAQTQQA